MMGKGLIECEGSICLNVLKSNFAVYKISAFFRYCDIFPKVNVKGQIKHLHLTPHELGQYEVQVEKVLKRYLKRLQWLLNGECLGTY